MAGALRDTFLAKKVAVRQGADTDGEVADGLSSSDSQSYNQKEPTSSDFMFHYAFLVVWRAVLEGGHCCRQLQTVSASSLNTKMLQTITNGCNRLQNEKNENL